MSESKLKDLKAPADARIDTATLAVLIRSTARLHVLDARTADADNGQRIPGARQVPPEASESQLKSVLPNRHALIVTYCANLHCPMSSQLASRLRSLGYENVLEYADGLAGWIAAGYPVEERQKDVEESCPRTVRKEVCDEPPHEPRHDEGKPVEADRHAGRSGSAGPRLHRA